MTVRVTDADRDKRLDVYTSEMLGISRSLAQGLINDGLVKVNGCSCSKNYKLRPSDEVDAFLPPPVETENKPQDIPVDIVYEDEHLLVVDKPRGMVVHPAAGNPDGTLVNALLFHCKGRLSSINGEVRPGIVHRIDKMTSGLLIVAKTDEAHRGLSEQIALHSFVRKYECVCIGSFKEDCGTVDKPIGRHRTDRKKMAVDPAGRNAVTHWRVLQRFDGFTHLECTLETGRTHQIRVHMQSIGHPLLGDGVYGDKKDSFHLGGQCLFAKYISFTHPITGQILSFEAPRPAYFQHVLDKLKDHTK